VILGEGRDRHAPNARNALAIAVGPSENFRGKEEARQTIAGLK
jgi:hypothetical protein